MRRLYSRPAARAAGDEARGERVGDGPERADRLAVGPTGEDVVAAERRSLAAEARVVAVRAGLALQARAHHHEAPGSP